MATKLPPFDPTIESEIFCYPKNMFETVFELRNYEFYNFFSKKNCYSAETIKKIYLKVELISFLAQKLLNIVI